MIATPILTLSKYLKTSIKKGVSKIEVFDFKENWCDENKIIIKLIKTEAYKYFVPPILDVGAGLGDIAFKAFPDKEAVCIDINKITKDEFPLSKNHQRIKINFFSYNPEVQIRTVFISHTLQFIDDDKERLNKKIKGINPDHVILVLNDNTDFMGEIIKWAFDNFKSPDPEERIKGFPDGYKLIKRIPFEAKISCPDFDKLARQICYLMVIELKNDTHQLKEFLKEKLNNKPQFNFKQSIEIYKRNG